MVPSPRPMRQQLVAATTQLRRAVGEKCPKGVYTVVPTALAKASAESKTSCRREEQEAAATRAGLWQASEAVVVAAAPGHSPDSVAESRT